jgi:hypothetical protein
VHGRAVVGILRPGDDSHPADKPIPDRHAFVRLVSPRARLLVCARALVWACSCAAVRLSVCLFGPQACVCASAEFSSASTRGLCVDRSVGLSGLTAAHAPDSQAVDGTRRVSASRCPVTARCGARSRPAELFQPAFLPITPPPPPPSSTACLDCRPRWTAASPIS